MLARGRRHGLDSPGSPSLGSVRVSPGKGAGCRKSSWGPSAGEWGEGDSWALGHGPGDFDSSLNWVSFFLTKKQGVGAGRGNRSQQAHATETSGAGGGAGPGHLLLEP